MTVSAHQAARLRYLHDSAHALILNAPTTSAVIGAEFNTLLDDNEVVTQLDRRREFCNACGNVMTPGSSCTISVERVPREITRADPTSSTASTNARKSRRSRFSKINEQKKVMIYNCHRCNRNTRFPMVQKPRVQTKNARIPQQQNETSVTGAKAKVTVDATPKEVQSSSSAASRKKRMKQNKQGGLSAMLAKKKSEDAHEAFDLMDFLKSG